MRGWIGTLLAACVGVAALTLDPALLFGKQTNEASYALAAILVSLAGLAFYLGRETSPLFFSRHLAMWMSGFAIIAIVASNFDLLKPKPEQEVIAKTSPTDAAALTPSKKPRRPAAEIYEPDTAKLDRVEKIVGPEGTTALNDTNEKRYKVKNLLSTKDAELPDDWAPSEEEKQAFKKYLESQGLKYDPETAFSFPPSANADNGAEFARR